MAEKQSGVRNWGIINLPGGEEDKWIAGAAVTYVDQDNVRTTKFVPIEHQEAPHPDVQESVGRILNQAWELADIDPEEER
ncbi:MAG: hypothetical protein ACTHXC_00595 [Brachybacterium sp.]